MAALGAAIGGNRPTLVVKVELRVPPASLFFSTRINCCSSELWKTLGAHSHQRRAVGQEEVYPSVVFFQDTYKLNIEHIFVAGLSDAGGAVPALLQAQRLALRIYGVGRRSPIGYRCRFDSLNGRMAGVVEPCLSYKCASISISQVSPTRMRGFSGCDWGGAGGASAF